MRLDGRVRSWESGSGDGPGAELGVHRSCRGSGHGSGGRLSVSHLPASGLTVGSAGWRGALQWGALVLCTPTFQVWLSSRFSGEGTSASPPALAASESGGPSTRLAEAAPSAPWSPGSTGHPEGLFLLPWRYGTCVNTQTRPSVLHGWLHHVFTAGLEMGRCREEQVGPIFGLTSSVLLMCKVACLSVAADVLHQRRRP